MNITIYTDGGARGNPGPAAIGGVIKKQEDVIYSFSKYIGRATNNIAEYAALVEALEWASGKSNIAEIVAHLDSELVVKQLNGLFKVKNSKLRTFLLKIRTLEQRIGARIVYRHIPRQYNSEADALVNQALDEKLPA